MKTLALAEGLDLPLSVVTQRLAFLGRTGSGKTYASMKLTELMLDAGLQVVVLDTVGVWPGLRLGPKPFSIPVFGGNRGDIPLLPTNGALIANLIVDRNISAVLDISMMIRDEIATFGADFARAFLQRKKSHSGPVHIVLEECQDLVTEEPINKLAKMCCDEWERVQKQGRNFQIGVSLISQRPQEVSKKVLNQTECLFAFQMTGPQERTAIANWIADKGGAADVKAVLPKLAVGQAFVWSPQWLDTSQIVKIHRKRTEDVAQNTGGRVRTRELSPIDLEKLREQVKEIVDVTASEDPKQLQAALTTATTQVRALTADVATLNKRVETLTAARAIKKSKIVVQTVTDARLNRVEDLIMLIGGHIEKIESCQRHLDDALMSLQNERDAIAETNRQAARIQREELAEALAPVLAHAEGRDRIVTTGTVQHTGVAAVMISGDRDPECDKRSARVLIALAQAGTALTNKQIGVRLGISHKTGPFSSDLGKCRARGWMEAASSGGNNITPAGLKALGTYTRLPEAGKPLREYWVNKLGVGGAGRMLQAFCDAYPHPLANAELGRRLGISHTTGPFSSRLGQLRNLDLISQGSPSVANRMLIGGEDGVL